MYLLLVALASVHPCPYHVLEVVVVPVAQFMAFRLLSSSTTTISIRVVVQFELMLKLIIVFLVIPLLLVLALALAFVMESLLLLEVVA